ncbi:MAG: phosphoglucosamine mutase [Eubacteriales bacterium]
MGKYFGTDGFRGEANKTLTAEHAFRTGRFLGWYYGPAGHGLRPRARIVVGKDPRLSSYMLEYALMAGLASSGADAYMLHVTTTPSIAFVTRGDDFDCGVMISASHNPFYDNGIKIISAKGEKLEEEVITLIESYLDGDLSPLGVIAPDLPLATGADIGCIVDYYSGRNRYVGYLISLAAHSFKSLRIGLDCANGAAWMIARSVFEALGAKTHVINAEPDGVNINRNAGSTHIEQLQRFVTDNRLDVGFAFDGDADRCLAVDEEGKVVTGDHILYIFAKMLRDQNILAQNTVVTTVMSNIGLYKALDELGIRSVKTAVGDKHVYENMQENGYCLGGEQSGHIILSKYATTGDGILTAIKLAEAMVASKLPLSKLTESMPFFPQAVRSVQVVDKGKVTENPHIKAEVTAITKQLGDNGRILLRASGTEPVVRIMVEAPTELVCQAMLKRIEDIIIQYRLYL